MTSLFPRERRESRNAGRSIIRVLKQSMSCARWNADMPVRLPLVYRCSGCEGIALSFFLSLSHLRPPPPSLSLSLPLYLSVPLSVCLCLSLFACFQTVDINHSRRTDLRIVGHSVRKFTSRKTLYVLFRHLNVCSYTISRVSAKFLTFQPTCKNKDEITLKTRHAVYY